MDVWQPNTNYRVGQKVVVRQDEKDFVLTCEENGKSGPEVPVIQWEVSGPKAPGGKYETSRIIERICDGTVKWSWRPRTIA
jgi:hypothetical protein